MKQADAPRFALAGRGLDGRGRVGRDDPPVLATGPVHGLTGGGRGRRRGGGGEEARRLSAHCRGSFWMRKSNLARRNIDGRSARHAAADKLRLAPGAVEIAAVSASSKVPRAMALA